MNRSLPGRDGGKALQTQGKAEKHWNRRFWDEDEAGWVGSGSSQKKSL